MPQIINQPVKSPVLLLIFNRPDTALSVFNQIKKARPSKLYIAADGPRSGRSGEAALCMKTREIADLVDWQCNLKTLFLKENLGCKIAVSSAIDWFFQQEQEGIILEDDCLPADDFFYFCDTLLEKHRQDTRIRIIAGTNQQQGVRWGEASYYFSQCSNIWGWASWKRVWQQYDVALKNYPPEEVKKQLEKVFDDRFLIEEWIRVYTAVKQGLTDTWDYQFHLINFFENGLCAVPNVNLVSNIGFRPDATHTTNFKLHSAFLQTGRVGPITHPKYYLPEKKADYFLLKNEFYLEEKWRKYNKKTKKLKRWLKSFFKKQMTLFIF